MDKLIITQHLKIEDSRKDLDLDGNPYDITTDFDSERISQWAAAIVLARYKIGEEVDSAELMNQFHLAKTQQLLDQMVDQGMVSMTLTETGEIGYIITDKGTGKIEGSSL